MSIKINFISQQKNQFSIFKIKKFFSTAVNDLDWFVVLVSDNTITFSLLKSLYKARLKQFKIKLNNVINKGKSANPLMN